MNHFQFVADHQTRYGVKRLCQILRLARSSYYYWRSTEAARAERDAADVVLAERIKAVHATHDGTYGAPRITAELQENGVAVNRNRWLGSCAVSACRDCGYAAASARRWLSNAVSR